MEQLGTIEKPEALVWTVKDLQIIFGWSKATAWARIWDGSVPSLKIGGRVFIPKKAVQEMLEQATK